MSYGLRYLLLPFSWLYGLIISIRNACYSLGIYTRTSFDFPVICIGNLTVGGTGKTPHIEWFIHTFSNEIKVAVLSRGYKRKTVGYRLASAIDDASTIGDEPFQLYKKFPAVAIAVAESRVMGIPYLLADKQDTDVILMDDGFQHLAIKAGLNILLCDYNNPYYDDCLLPAGLLREHKHGATRAEVIIVSKCPADLSIDAAQTIIKKIAPLPSQQVFFTTLVYGECISITASANQTKVSSYTNAVALSGIAKANLFINQIKLSHSHVKELTFSDHQHYTADRIQQLAEVAESIKPCAIITTEKDAVKLMAPDILPHINHLPIWYIPIRVKIMFDQEEELITIIRRYLESYQQQSHE
ncbi:MAG: tetraacyldisaccharide 4'-kinase [Bacteroidia bacterium]|jgi:tetraacyldisaccharide 4'-kinase|nr:tetraacyldisaccharide 4'-kinase [Bacteroidia bacterium]